MKTIIITLLSLALLSSLCDSQTKVTKTQYGNYTSVKKAVDTSKSVQVATFTDSKVKYGRYIKVLITSYFTTAQAKRGMFTKFI